MSKNGKVLEKEYHMFLEKYKYILVYFDYFMSF